MNCIGNEPDDQIHKFSSNAFVDLAYDIGITNCYVKIKTSYLIDNFGYPLPKTKSTPDTFEEWLENERIKRYQECFIFETPKTFKLLQYSFIRIEKIIRKTLKLYQNNLAQTSRVYWTKLYLKWKSYYNRIKMTILGEK